MDLLPSSYTEFSQANYWEKFFKKRGNIPFEWYGEYIHLHSVIHKYIVPSNSILVVGSGNSVLSEEMYDNGLQNIQNIDISEVAVRQMRDRNSAKRKNMSYLQMDVTQMSFPDNHFHVALDKGTLDALLVDENEATLNKVNTMFEEISRTLKLGGRYMIVSLLQDHVQKAILQFFTRIKWPIRIHRVSTESVDEDNSAKTNSPSMPVFVVVLTKLKCFPGMPQIVEVCRYEDKVDRLEDVKYLSEIVKDIQHYHMVRQQLQSRLSDEQQVTVELHNRDSISPRYRLTVVDSPTTLRNKFAIFIVPQGRENEWLFSSDKGRQQLQSQTDYQRLVVVRLNRDHEYENLEAIKADLSSKVMDLAPSDCSPNFKVPFLSVGEDIGKRMLLYQGNSDISGDYLVEDVEINGGQIFRRLIFLSSQNVTQSEARIVKRNKKRRKGKQVDEDILKVDKGHLTNDYLIAATAGLAFLDNFENETKGLLLGLGGGCWASFIQACFPQITLDAVELDPSVVDVARNWFELVPNDKLHIHVADGLAFARNLVANGEKRDIVLLDIDNKDLSVGLNCPPRLSLETEFLLTYSKLIGNTGVLVMNLCSRDEALGESVIQQVASTFNTAACLRLEEDVNIIIFASNRQPSEPGLQLPTLVETFHRLDQVVLSRFKDTNVSIVDIMEKLQLINS